jgi:PKD repeat protein
LAYSAQYIEYYLMKRFLLLVVAYLFSVAGFAQNNQALLNQKYSFIENKGQVADENNLPANTILFTSQINGAQLFLAKNGLHYQWKKQINPPTADAKRDAEAYIKQMQESSLETYRMDIELVGANPNPVVEKLDAADDYINYYQAQCPQGIFGVKHYARVIYKNVYPNIDWVWYNKNGQVKYDFVVHPGADYKQIKLKISGAENINIAEDGSLEINTPLGQVKENAPLTFQGGEQIVSMFKLLENTVTFHIGPTNTTQDIIIDPIIILWSTYYGGDMNDISNQMATGLINNNVYIVGSTASSSNIFYNGFSNNIYGQSGEAFLAKFDEHGKRLWATYYGGVSIDVATDVDVDLADNIYMAGYTNSTDSIAYNGFQNSNAGGNDALLVKFNPAGLRIWATYYGGTGSDNSIGVCASLQNVYITGITTSTSGVATSGSYSSNQDTYVAQFDTGGNRVAGVYYGGTGYDGPFSMHMDNAGDVYVSGQTYSTSAIYYKGYLSTYQGKGDAFLAKFNPALALLWSTYYGGSEMEYGIDVTTDSLNNVFLAGQTSSTYGVATSSAFQTFLNGTQDGFLAKFNASGTRVWGTYFGGGDMDDCMGVAVNQANDIYITGKTHSKTGVEYNGINKTLKGNTDIYVAKFNSGGSRIWGTYFGDTLVDQSNAIACDRRGAIYITGYVNSIKNIAVNGHQNTQGGGQDAFLTKFFDKDLSIPAFTQNVYCGKTSFEYALTSPWDSFFKARWYHDTTANWYYEGDTLVVSKTDTSWVRWESARGNGPWQKEITTIYPSPIADFTLNDTVQCWLGNNFVFTNTTDTSGVNTAYIWYFGDNSSSTAVSPTHHYTFSGIYSVQLAATSLDNSNCSPSAISKIVRVFNEPRPILYGKDKPQQNTIESYSTDPLNAATYNWIITGGTLITGAGTNAISVLWGNGNSGEVGLVITDRNGCQNVKAVLQVGLLYNAVQGVPGSTVKIYPVPAHNTLMVAINQKAMYQIVDVLGKTITTGSLNGNGEEGISISNLSPSTYVIRITTAEGALYNLKFAVN